MENKQEIIGNAISPRARGDTRVIEELVQALELGQTGRADCPHLHFEVRVGEKAVNPEYYLP